MFGAETVYGNMYMYMYWY